MSSRLTAAAVVSLTIACGGLPVPGGVLEAVYEVPGGLAAVIRDGNVVWQAGGSAYSVSSAVLDCSLGSVRCVRIGDMQLAVDTATIATGSEYSVGTVHYLPRCLTAQDGKSCNLVLVQFSREVELGPGYRGYFVFSRYAGVSAWFQVSSDLLTVDVFGFKSGVRLLDENWTENSRRLGLLSGKPL